MGGGIPVSLGFIFICKAHDSGESAAKEAKRTCVWVVAFLSSASPGTAAGARLFHSMAVNRAIGGVDYPSYAPFCVEKGAEPRTRFGRVRESGNKERCEEL